MRYKAEVFETAKDLIDSTLDSELSPEETLETLERTGIDCYLTEEGTLAVKIWQFFEGFVSPEEAAVIRPNRSFPEEASELDWLSRNLQTIRAEHGGQWVAISGNEIAASASSLPDLMTQITGLDKPFITFISSEPAVWNFVYAD